MSQTILYLSFPGPQPASLGIEEELRQIQARLSVASFGAEWQVLREEQPLFDDLPGLFSRTPHQVLHLSSHGTQDGRLELREGEAYFSYAPEQVLPVLLASPARLIVLNACFSATLAEALQQQGRLVIGSTRRVPSDIAGRFAGVLYELLAQGKRLKDAFSAAQHVVTAADPSLFSLYKLYEPEAAEELCFPPTPLPQVVLSSLPSETPTNQVVILLDAYGGTVDPYLARVPDRRADRKVLQLSTFLKDYGLRPLDHQSPPLSWELLAEATEALVKAALQAFPEQPKSYYIGGNAPHATFAHLGFGLSHWAGRQVLLHQNPDQSWLDIDLSLSPTGSYFFEATSGLERDSVADGLVGLYLGAMGGGLPPGTSGFFRSQGLHRAGMVALTHKGKGADGLPSAMNAFDGVNT
ncbi:MAG TPA: CHAT domain-containing protein, partial [Myxococcota bacterium]|nr:CHAT domain-containing protein [Myxococcota bacterium]